MGRGERTMAQELLIGEVARLTGLNPKTIRYYEEIGVGPRAGRTNHSHGAGYRVFTAADVRRLEFIKRARLVGLTLTEIKEFLNSAATSTPERLQHLDVLIEEKLREIDRQLSDLQALRVDLMQVRKRLELKVIPEPGACCDPLCGPETCG
jgi:DNA-binding transcriptional MerR regulator